MFLVVARVFKVVANAFLGGC